MRASGSFLTPTPADTPSFKPESGRNEARASRVAPPAVRPQYRPVQLLNTVFARYALFYITLEMRQEALFP